MHDFQFRFTDLFPYFSYHFITVVDVRLGIHKSFVPDDDDEQESSIRRACSLSDLSMGKGKSFFLLSFRFYWHVKLKLGSANETNSGSL